MAKLTAKEKAASVLARYEAGKPADPTENMSEEDAKTWWSEHEKHKDLLKEATNKTSREALPKQEIAKRLYDFVEVLYKSRGPLRDAKEMVHDLFEDALGLSGFHGYANETVKESRDQLRELDTMVGETCHMLENLARRLKTKAE